MEENDGFIPISAIFYAVFHPTEGTKIVHQVPANSVTSKDDDSALFDFDAAKNFIIPKPQLCNKLISFKINKFRVIGYPVHINNSVYARNSFNFNFCFVFDSADVTPYQAAIVRIGNMFKVLEEQNFMLSKLDKSNSFYKSATNNPIVTLLNTPGHSRTGVITLSSIESLISQIYQDLNNYSECCIPIDSANSVDIKLFPMLPPPIDIKAFQVPIATVNLNTLIDINSDPTMLKILPFINGLNSIKKISELANASFILTKQCIQHLMHYKCIKLIDIFQFSNIYAPTNYIKRFLLHDYSLAEECQAYIISNDNYLSHQAPMSSSSSGILNTNSVSPSSRSELFSRSKSNLTLSQMDKVNITIPSKATLFYLYRCLNQSQTVKEWYVQNRKLLVNIDVRRFINFGILRRLIYRVHSYPILNSITRSIEKGEYFDMEISKKNSLPKEDLLDRKVNFLKSIQKDESDDSESASSTDEDESSDEEHFGEPASRTSTTSIVEEDEEMRTLFKLLKGFQHFDSICTELQKSRSEVELMISKIGSYNLVNS